MTTLGILGGGQLGRMLFQAALDLDLRVHVLDPDPQAPCSGIAHEFHTGDLKDYDTVYAFGQSCEVLTIEIEKVNTQALRRLRDEGKRVYPQPEVIECIQDKSLQKAFYDSHCIPTAPWRSVLNRAEVAAYRDRLPLVNKLARDGYDGRGVQILRTPDDLPLAFDAPGILEELIPLQTELAVVVARRPGGDMRCFPVVQMDFHPQANLVELLFAPAGVSDYVQALAEQWACTIAEKLEIVGLLAVEFFLDSQGRLWVNEAAPRPHNSGHASIEANRTSQFEQHLRAILDLPLGDTDLSLPSAMINLLGEPGYQGQPVYEGLHQALQLGGVYPHFYGKQTTKPFRKMGHVTVLDPDPKRLLQKAQKVKDFIKVKGSLSV